MYEAERGWTPWYSSFVCTSCSRRYTDLWFTCYAFIIVYLNTKAQEEVELNYLSQRKTYIYFCPNDYVLSYGYPMCASGVALGKHGWDASGVLILTHRVVGPQKAYQNVESVDVTQHFGLSVHFNYRKTFHKFAKEKPSVWAAPCIASLGLWSMFLCFLFYPPIFLHVKRPWV